MRAALLVGINEYNNFPQKNLPCCISDVYKLDELLSYNADATRNFDCTSIANSPGGILDTAPQIRQSLIRLFSLDAEIALFYFSGHGILTDADGYIVTSDAQVDNWGISMHEILVYAQKSKIKNKVIILDCCHAGSMGNFPLKEDCSIIGNGMTVLASCRDTEFSLGDGSGSVFTSLIAEALRGGAADLMGNVSPGNIYSFVDSALGAWDQRPIFKTNVSEFISLRKAVAPIPFATLRLLSVYFRDSHYEFQLNPSFEHTSSNSDSNNVRILKNLQQMERVGLVVPISEEHMYDEVMKSGRCKLTALGAHYWDLANKGRLK